MKLASQDHRDDVVPEVHLTRGHVQHSPPMHDTKPASLRIAVSSNTLIFTTLRRLNLDATASLHPPTTALPERHDSRTANMAEPENATKAPESDAQEPIIPGDTPAQTGVTMGAGEHCVTDRPTRVCFSESCRERNRD